MKYILMGLGLYFLYKTFFQKSENASFQNQQNFKGQNPENGRSNSRDGEYVDYEDLTNK